MKNMSSILICLLFASFGWQQASAQRFGGGEKGEKIKALWVAFVTQKLDLNSDESAKFWPIYNDFIDKELELNKRKRKLNKKPIAEMSEAEVDAYFNQVMSVEEQLIALKREYYGKLKTAIPAQKIVQLPQIERDFKKKIIQFIQERRGNNIGGGRGRGQ